MKNQKKRKDEIDMKRSKLITVLLMCTMLITTILPTVVFAASEGVSSEIELNAAISKATGTEDNPTVIDISADFTIRAAIHVPNDKNVVINGNNHTISRADDSTNYASNGSATLDTHAMFYIEGYAKFTDLSIDAKGDETHILRAVVVKDGTADVYLGNGKITGAYLNSSGGALVAVGADGVVNFYSGELSNNSAKTGAALLGDKGGIVNMYGGAITANTGFGTDGILLYAYGDSRINLFGGSVENNTVKGGALYQLNKQMYTISGDFVISGNKNGEGALADINLVESSMGYKNIINGKNYTMALESIDLTSPLKSDLYFSTSDDSSWPFRRTLLEGANGYTITESDLEKVHLTNNGTDITNDDTYFKAIIDNRIEFFKKVTITYAANYEGSTDTATQATGYGAKTTLNANTFKRDGFTFAGWNTKPNGTGTAYADKAVAENSTSFIEDTTLYAQWIEVKIDDVSMEYGSTKELPTVSEVTLSEWTSADESVAKVENGKIKAVNAGKTTLSAKASTTSGLTGTITVNVEVTPMSIIYGSPDETEDGRPYIVYSLNEDGTTPKISDILGFYPVKEKQGESGYEADTSKPKITLNPGMGADGDVEYTYVNDVSNNKITTDTLPTHPTVDENGNPHSIRVEMKLKNPNYRFTTIGTNWQQGDTITLFVTCYEEGMNEVDMYLEGESEPLKIFEEQIYEYTGQGVVPTTKDLTTLYTKGKNTSNTITKFTAHFHAVDEDTKFVSTHLESVVNTELTAKALGSIAPKELGVYSFVINGYNKDTKTYSYVSRHYSIVKGNPKGNPVFDVIESGKSLSEVQLSGTMKNKIGETVAGTFTWEDGNQTVESGKAYKWTFTPDDTNHYEVVNGESIVCPIPMEELNAIPTINASDKTLTVGDTFNPLDGVTASDKEDGDITEKVEVLSNDVDTSKAGTYTVIYKVTDSKGASSTKTITVTVKGKDTQKPTIDDNKKPSATDTDKKPASTDKQTTSNSPKTGDSTNMTTWLALMFVSLGLLAGVFTVRKSRKSR